MIGHFLPAGKLHAARPGGTQHRMCQSARCWEMGAGTVHGDL